MWARSVVLLRVVVVTICANLSSAFQWVKDPGAEIKLTYPNQKTLVLRYEWRLSGREVVNQAEIRRYKTKDKDNTDKAVGTLYSNGGITTKLDKLEGGLGTAGGNNGYIELTINDIKSQGNNEDNSVVNVMVSNYTYECKVTIIAVSSPYSKSTNLIVYVLPGRPVLQLQPNHIGFCYRNNTIKITCNAVVGNPAKTNWTFFLNNSSIQMIAGEQSGNYTKAVITRYLNQPGTFLLSCQATNLAGSSASSVVTITVKDPPVITSCTNKTITEKNNLVWTCDVSGSQPLTISWFKGNNNTVIQSGENFNIATASRDDSGMYRFTASNGGECPTDNATVYLDVQYSPTCSDDTFEVANGQCFSIQSDGNPLPTLNCFPPDNIIIAQNGNSYTMCGAKSNTASICTIANIVGRCRFTLQVYQIECSQVPAIVLGVLFAISLIFNLIFVGYFVWKRKFENKAKPNSSSSTNVGSLNMNNIALQEEEASNVAQYESVGNQEQQQPTTQLYQSLQTPSDTYSSLSPNTKLPPRPAVITNSGVYQDLQGVSHQYQSLDNSSRV